jgi:zinc protease
MNTTQTIQYERSRINGMPVLLVARPGLGLAAATVLIRRGSCDEPEDEHGLASFAVSMLMRGSLHRSSEQLAFDLESIGAISGESDGRDSCTLGIRSGAPEFFEGLEILFETLLEPAFEKQETEIHRQEIMADLRMQEDDKFHLTYREYQKRMFSGHGYSHPCEGLLNDVKSITPDNCRRWHRGTVLPQDLVFIAAGDFKFDELARHLESLTSSWNGGRESGARCDRIHHRGRSEEYVFSKPDLQQAIIVMGFKTPTIMDADYPALRLASAVLGEGFGGRIFSELRDKRSLAYALGASLNSYRLGGHQILYIGTKPESVDEARGGLFEQVDYILQHRIDEDSLNRAREFVLGRILMGLQSLSQRVGRLAWWEDMTGDASNVSGYMEKLKHVTPEQLQEAASRWWINPTVVILKPES